MNERRDRDSAASAVSELEQEKVRQLSDAPLSCCQAEIGMANYGNADQSKSTKQPLVIGLYVICVTFYISTYTLI